MNATAATERAREFQFTAQDFAFIAELVGRTAGIVLTDNKREMIYGRMSRRLRALGMTTFAEYRKFLETPGGTDELSEMINSLTTNLTKFFRENHHFDHLAQNAVAEAAKRTAGRQIRLRIWSAGCSSGQEPFSIAMTIAENIPDFARHDIKILATDLDSNMVARCRTGEYAAAEVESIPAGLKSRWLRPIDATKSKYVFDDSLRRLIRFNTLNLLHEWPMKGPFDAVFLRNVIIYFNNDTQRMVVERIYDLLSDVGFLYLGHSENMARISPRFANHGHTIHSKIRGS